MRMFLCFRVDYFRLFLKSFTRLDCIMFAGSIPELCSFFINSMNGSPSSVYANLFRGHSPLQENRYLHCLHFRGSVVCFDWPKSISFEPYIISIIELSRMFPNLYLGKTKWSHAYMSPLCSIIPALPQLSDKEQTPGFTPTQFARVASNV